MTKLTREITLEHSEESKIWPDLLPVFIIVGVLIIGGILILCEKIREQLLEKEPEADVTDSPPSYDDISVNSEARNEIEVRSPPPYRPEAPPPSYEFVNAAFQPDDPPPPYVVSTQSTFVN